MTIEQVPEMKADQRCYCVACETLLRRNTNRPHPETLCFNCLIKRYPVRAAALFLTDEAARFDDKVLPTVPVEDVAARLRELAQAIWNLDSAASPRDLINERTR